MMIRIENDNVALQSVAHVFFLVNEYLRMSGPSPWRYSSLSRPVFNAVSWLLAAGFGVSPPISHLHLLQLSAIGSFHSSIGLAGVGRRAKRRRWRSSRFKEGQSGIEDETAGYTENQTSVNANNDGNSGISSFDGAFSVEDDDEERQEPDDITQEDAIAAPYLRSAKNYDAGDKSVIIRDEDEKKRILPIAATGAASHGDNPPPKSSLTVKVGSRKVEPPLSDEQEEGEPLTPALLAANAAAIRVSWMQTSYQILDKLARHSVDANKAVETAFSKTSELSTHLFGSLLPYPVKPGTAFDRKRHHSTISASPSIYNHPAQKQEEEKQDSDPVTAGVLRITEESREESLHSLTSTAPPQIEMDSHQPMGVVKNDDSNAVNKGLKQGASRNDNRLPIAGSTSLPSPLPLRSSLPPKLSTSPPTSKSSSYHAHSTPSPASVDGVGSDDNDDGYARAAAKSWMTAGRVLEALFFSVRPEIALSASLSSILFAGANGNKQSPFSSSNYTNNSVGGGKSVNASSEQMFSNSLLLNASVLIPSLFSSSVPLRSAAMFLRAGRTNNVSRLHVQHSAATAGFGSPLSRPAKDLRRLGADIVVDNSKRTGDGVKQTRMNVELDGDERHSGPDLQMRRDDKQSTDDATAANKKRNDAVNSEEGRSSSLLPQRQFTWNELLTGPLTRRLAGLGFDFQTRINNQDEGVSVQSSLSSEPVGNDNDKTGSKNSSIVNGKTEEEKVRDNLHHGRLIASDSILPVGKEDEEEQKQSSISPLASSSSPPSASSSTDSSIPHEKSKSVNGKTHELFDIDDDYDDGLVSLFRVVNQFRVPMLADVVEVWQSMKKGHGIMKTVPFSSYVAASRAFSALPFYYRVGSANASIIVPRMASSMPTPARRMDNKPQNSVSSGRHQEEEEQQRPLTGEEDDDEVQNPPASNPPPLSQSVTDSSATPLSDQDNYWALHSGGYYYRPETLVHRGGVDASAPPVRVPDLAVAIMRSLELPMRTQMTDVVHFFASASASSATPGSILADTRNIIARLGRETGVHVTSFAAGFDRFGVNQAAALALRNKVLLLDVMAARRQNKPRFLAGDNSGGKNGGGQDLSLTPAALLDSPISQKENPDSDRDSRTTLPTGAATQEARKSRERGRKREGEQAAFDTDAKEGNTPPPPPHVHGVGIVTPAKSILSTPRSSSATGSRRDDDDNVAAVVALPADGGGNGLLDSSHVNYSNNYSSYSSFEDGYDMAVVGVERIMMMMTTTAKQLRLIQSLPNLLMANLQYPYNNYHRPYRLPSRAGIASITNNSGSSVLSSKADVPAGKRSANDDHSLQDASLAIAPPASHSFAPKDDYYSIEQKNIDEQTKGQIGIKPASLPSATPESSTAADMPSGLTENLTKEIPAFALSSILSSITGYPLSYVDEMRAFVRAGDKKKGAGKLSKSDTASFLVPLIPNSSLTSIILPHPPSSSSSSSSATLSRRVQATGQQMLASSRWDRQHLQRLSGEAKNNNNYNDYALTGDSGAPRNLSSSPSSSSSSSSSSRAGNKEESMAKRADKMRKKLEKMLEDEMRRFGFDL